MIEDFVFFGAGDFFYNREPILLAIFLLMFTILVWTLERSPFGRKGNRGVIILISFIVSVLAVYWFYRSWDVLPFGQLGFLWPFRGRITEFLNGLGILGAVIVLIFLGIALILVRAFVRFVRINWGK